LKEKSSISQPILFTQPCHPVTLGTEILSGKLSKVMFTHIKHNLPEITKEIKEKAKDIEERPQRSWTTLPSESTEKMHSVDTVMNWTLSLSTRIPSQESSTLRGIRIQMLGQVVRRSSLVVLRSAALL